MKNKRESMKPTIEDTILVDRNVNLALQMLRRRMAAVFVAGGMDTLEHIEADYMLMCGSFERGLRDPKGGEVYDDLLRRTYRLYNNVRLASIVRKRPAYARCKGVADEFMRREGSVRVALEEYVQEMAMATLQPDSQRQAFVRKANAAHQRYMEELFNSLVVAEQWSVDTSTSYTAMLLSPTIDMNDALVIVSALTLSLLTVFDVGKWLTLVGIYRDAAAEPLRQRALVGLTLTMPDKEIRLFAELRDGIKTVCGSDKMRREMLELQMQLFYCSRTKDENEEIQRDIMPTLIKNNNLKMTRKGIVESEDSIDDILGTGDSDRNMEELEAKMDKMKSMQKAGGDIFFGGFSHMKRFSFFYQISNWFVPFSTGHPEMASVIGGESGAFVKGTLGGAPFCDSDKYSFAFALASIVDKLPNNIKEMMASGKGVMEFAEVDMTSPAYIRRMYLQDIYRFFMLFRDKSDFANPFVKNTEDGKCGRLVFFGNELLDGLMDSEMPEVVRFFLRQRQFDVVERLVSRRAGTGTAANDELMALGQAYMRLGKYSEAYGVFASMHEMGNTELVLKGKAEALFMMRRYDEAADVYGELLELECKKKSYVLNHSLALINSDKTKEGMDNLFRLDYEDPSDVNVKRAIAWGYLMGGKPHEAERVYENIKGMAGTSCSDTLNGGYAKWMQGKNAEAIALFIKYAADGDNDIAADFAVDGELFRKYGVEDYELTLMLDIVRRGETFGN